MKTIIMKTILYLYIVLFSALSIAQKKDSIPNFDEYLYLKDGDSLNIKLDEVTVLPKHKFKSRIDANYYLWFRKKVFKAYPYAVMVSSRIDSLNVRLSRIPSKRKKKKYIKTVQRYVEKELTDQLKNMTRTEGRVLIKLVYRQTGKTVYDNVGELRSGWKAFWYNTKANLFGISLKLEYDPSSINEDYLIEDVLQRSFLDEKLEYQMPKLKIDSFKILAQKRGEINVEEYKRMFEKLNKKRKKKK